MKTVSALLILGFLSLHVVSQNATMRSNCFNKKNSVQLELFGHGLFYSINYERILLNEPKLKTSVQAGVAYYPPKTGIIDLWLPVSINQLFSFNNHHIEVGLGHVLVNEANRQTDLGVISREWNGFSTARVGYRFQKPDGRFILRAGFTPFSNFPIGVEIYPSAGLTVGYSF